MEKELKDYLDQNFAKLATKEEMKAEVMNLRSEMKTEITGLRSEMRTEIGTLRTDTEKGIADLRTEVSTLRTDTENGMAGLRTEIGTLRTDTEKGMADLRTEVSTLRTDTEKGMAELRSEMKDMENRVLHQFHITAEALRDDIKLVAEGVMTLNEKVEREMSQFRKEMAYSHEELKAMIKFSYSELDRRITTLEHDLENLKRRVEKIERSSSAS